MNEFELRRALSDFTNTLESGGPNNGLAFLNARVPHRYTAVFQLRDAVLHNICLFDKQGQLTPPALREVPLKNSFCQFVLRDGIFSTFDASSDDRLDGVQNQTAFNSYVGFPLLNNVGELFGTLCHIDYEAHPVPEAEFYFLQHAARTLPRYLKKTLTDSAPAASP